MRFLRRLESSRCGLPISLAFVVALTLVYYPSHLQIALGSIGFPLDDSWIYQTLARNLARYGTLAYNPGEPAAAATSILWVPLLSLSYLLKLDPILWAYALGSAALLALGCASYLLSLALFPGRREIALSGALVVVADWRMAWSAMSGMDTTLFTLLAVVFIWAALSKPKPFLVGVIGGLLVAARPEGMLLVSAALVLDLLLLSTNRSHGGARRLGWTVAGLATTLAPYFALSWAFTGHWLPNTFYAKQAFYANSVTSIGRIVYLLDAVRVILLGPAANALLAIGSLFAVYKVLSSRDLLRCLPLFWAILLLGAYALRLPITLQHGRYIMPLIPIAIIFSVAGCADLLALARRRSFVLLPTVFPFIAGLAVLASWVIGAKILAADVEVINTQQVATARWIETHTASDSLVATHDIGALAYFSNRKIVDTVGLIDPDFIPLIGKQNAILASARNKGAQYLAFLPDWYPGLATEKTGDKVYEAGGDALVKLGYQNMVVYRLDKVP